MNPETTSNNKIKKNKVPSTRQNFWSNNETKEMFRLNNAKMSNKDIAIILSEKFNTFRTEKAVKGHLEQESKKYYNINTDKLIVKNIRKYPGNFQYSFEVSSKELNVEYNGKIPKTFTKNSIQGRYYNFIRHNYDVISIGSEEGFLLNIKNVKRTENIKQPKLTPVLLLLKEILNLSDSERKDLIRFLNTNS